MAIPLPQNIEKLQEQQQKFNLMFNIQLCPDNDENESK